MNTRDSGGRHFEHSLDRTKGCKTKRFVNLNYGFAVEHTVVELFEGVLLHLCTESSGIARFLGCRKKSFQGRALLHFIKNPRFGRDKEGLGGTGNGIVKQSLC